MSQAFSVDWNGTDFLLSGDGLLHSSFPTLSLYENNYYVFNNNSTIAVSLSIGEDNNTQYQGFDIWNNGSHSDDEYSLFSPELNSSRVLYYFNPEDNASVGQINISPHDSQFFHPQVNETSLKFGQSVVINDWNQTIIGSPGETISHDGAIHVFNKEVNGSYSYLEKIIPSVSGQNGQFGHAMEVENQFLFVSSPDSSTSSGLVDIFTRESNGSYGFTESLNTVGENLDSFGWDISAADNYLAVSSLQSINNGGGKISIFENNGTNWGIDTVLRADDNQSNDEFGYSLNLSGPRLLVGAPKADANGTDSGAAYIFEQNASGWFQTAKLSPIGLSAGDEFGYSVSLTNNLAFVGARQKDGNGTNAGAVYIFHLNGLNWEQVSIIYPPQDQSNQFFSSDLKVNTDILAVSSPSQGEGYVHLYRVESNGSNISLISSLSLDESNSTDQGFLSIALKNGTAIVGIPGDSTFADVGGGALAFHNDAWQMKVLPDLAPIIDYNASINHTIAEDSGIYQYDFNGSHPFDSDLIWSLSLHPDGNATFDLNSTTGMFSYTPDGNFSGIHSFRATLSNENYFDIVDFNVTVTPVQDAPIFITSSIPSGMEGDDYNQTISVFDADGDNLSLSYNSTLVGLGLTGFTIAGIPGGGSANGQAYQDYNVTLSLNDGTDIVQKSFNLQILKRNNPPQIWVNGDSNLSVLPDIILSEDFNETSWYASLPLLDYNDSDGHRVDLNVTVYPTHGNLTWDINATDLNRSISYTPFVPHFNGTDSFTMILRDIEGEGNKSTLLTFNLVISPVNDPPVISSVPAFTVVNEGSMFHYPLVLLDPDLNDVRSTELLNVTVENLPSSGWLEYNSTTQILSGTPSWSDYEEVGPRLIVIKVVDQAGLEDTQAFTLQVIPNNYPPVISQGATFSTSLNEDSIINTWSGLDLSVTGLDQTLGTLTWVISQQAQNGIASVTGTGTTPSSLSYQPDGNFSGTDYFLVQVFESLDPNASDVIRINLNVLPVEDDPVFKSSTSGVAIQDFLFDYNITTFDADLGANVTISSLVPLPGWLNLSDFGNGSARLSGSPNQYDLGNNLIVLEVRDQTNRFAVQAFMLVVLDENNNPVIAQGETTSFVHTEDLTWNGSSLISATDIDGQFLNWTLKSSPSNGSAQVSGQGSSPPVLDYTPDSNFSGFDSFQVEVSDGIGSDLITIILNIQNVDDAPVFSILPTDQITIDNQTFTISPKVYDADSLIGSEIQLTGPSWLGVSSFDRSNGVILLEGVPGESDEGNSSFSIRITDSTGLYNSAEFDVQVRVLNYAPIINSGLASVSVTMVEDQNSTWIAPVLVGIDMETPSSNLVWSVFSHPSHGTVIISGNGSSPATFDYSPDGNFSGSDSFTVKVTDGGGIEGSPSKYDTILVNVEVSPVNDPPVFISTPSYSWNDESVYVYNVNTYDADWNYEWHSIDLNVSGNLPEWLTFKDEGNGTGLLYGLATVQEEGNYTISFEVFDSNQTSTIQNFTLEIRIDNYPPVFKSVSESNKTISELLVYVDEDSNLSSARGGWVAPSDYIAEDPDPTEPSPIPLTWSLAENPKSGASVVVQDSPNSGVIDRQRPYLFSYLPRHNFFGDDTIQLKVSDGNRSSILPVRVKVRALPDA
ncbi:MAG: tandem-95 repeat protein, partial [Opitutales bacterium]|nr:tandem-95 repeat protein [Opitutales bacterium]